MRIHIALVGGQTMPVFMGVMESDADQIILIHSEDSEPEAIRIKSNLDKEIQMKKLDSVNYKSIYNSVEKLYEEYAADNEIVVNITSGTKPWAIAFYSIFGNKKNVEIQYIDQNCCVYNYSTLAEKMSSLQLSTQRIFDFNGQRADYYSNIRDYTNEDASIINIVKKIRSVNYSAFNYLTIPIKENFKKLEEQSGFYHHRESDSFIKWDKKKNEIEIQIVGRNNKIKRLLNSAHVFNIVFFSGWFELETAMILAKWGYSKEIWLNVKFPYKNGSTKNEIDIIVNTGNKLLFVECKTQIFDQTDIDKFRTAVKNYGGMGCKALFVTQALMKDNAKEKCGDSGIITFSMSEQCGDPFIQKVLFEKLEKELFQINTK